MITVIFLIVGIAIIIVHISILWFKFKHIGISIIDSLSVFTGKNAFIVRNCIHWVYLNRLVVVSYSLSIITFLFISKTSSTIRSSRSWVNINCLGAVSNSTIIVSFSVMGSTSITVCISK
ncbi:membrane protein [Candidatus Magnetobacterium bavaricum]|uniref:Membrane protein n=1 Tax=Candidatus Magnetobacterium bavaricum TaxID=29290 RepID=A0A0F3GXB3_9BACT|nr:membrane protein [Candidatus Magnetobacterium bavaricum]